MMTPRKPFRRIINPHFEFVDKKGRLRTLSKKAVHDSGLRENLLAKARKSSEVENEKKLGRKERRPSTLSVGEIDKILTAAGFRKIDKTHYHHPVHGGIQFGTSSRGSRGEIRDPHLVTKIWKFKK